MEARAYLRYARIAPRKVQIVLDLIRNQPVDKAIAILKHTPKAASELLLKLLNLHYMLRIQLKHLFHWHILIHLLQKEYVRWQQSLLPHHLL